MEGMISIDNGILVISFFAHIQIVNQFLAFHKNSAGSDVREMIT
jgi:hypothetical protein